MNPMQWLQSKSFPLAPGAAALMILMAATRFHHFGTPWALPDASLAVFFLGGLWFGRRPLFAALLAEAALIDFIAITQMQVSDFCISPAYGFLLPTYAIMWLSGRRSSRFQRQSLTERAMQLAVLVSSTAAAFLISNGSFNLLSGRYPEPPADQFFSDALHYFPAYLTPTVIYVVVIMAAVNLARLLPALHTGHKPA